jgi:hypothetical protein
VFPSQSPIFPKCLVYANPPSQPFLRPQIEREYWSREYASFHSLHIITRDLFGRSLLSVRPQIQILQSCISGMKQKTQNFDSQSDCQESIFRVLGKVNLNFHERQSISRYAPRRSVSTRARFTAGQSPSVSGMRKSLTTNPTLTLEFLPPSFLTRPLTA